MSSVCVDPPASNDYPQNACSGSNVERVNGACSSACGQNSTVNNTGFCVCGRDAVTTPTSGSHCAACGGGFVPGDAQCVRCQHGESSTPGTCNGPPTDPCGGLCTAGRVCSDGACACPGSEHIHQGTSCHAPSIGHSCQSGQHKVTHSISGCHANHVCTGDQTGGGAADCADPSCVGDQTLSAGKVCLDPACVGDQMLSVIRKVCVDPACQGDQTLSAGKVCVDPTCLGDQTLTAGECVDPACQGDQTLSAGECVDPACQGDQTLSAGKVCVDPACQGDQTLSAGKVCVDPACQGDQTVSAGECVDPMCAGDQTLTAGECVDPACVDGTVSAGVCSCPTGRSLIGGECVQMCPDGTGHRHAGAPDCHAAGTVHDYTCPPGRHLDGHSLSTCHANHVCIGDQTGGGAADCVDPSCQGDQTLSAGECRDPACQGDQTLSAGKVCVDPACQGDQTLSAGKVCVDPACQGDQTLSAGKVCVDPACQGDQTVSAGECVDPACQGDQTLTAGECVDPACVDGTVSAGVCRCPTGAGLAGGECKCGDSSAPPCGGVDPPLLCQDGTAELAGRCVACPLDSAGTGGDCFACGAGRIANTGSTACVACPAGRHEARVRGSCHANHVCTGDQTGGGAADCVDPSCVGDQTLSNGKVCVDPTCVGDQTLSNGKVCLDPACAGGTVTAGGECSCRAGAHENVVGECNTCPGGTTSDAGVRETCYPCPTDTAVVDGVCTTCGDGEVPDEAGTACAACPTGQREGAGDMRGACLCPTGQTADGDDCVCRDGEVVYGAACLACPVDTAGTGGVCARCPAGRVPSADRTECLACPAGQWERSVSECADCPTGRVPNAAGTACAACPTGQTPNADRSACLCPTGQTKAGDSCLCGDGEVAYGAACLACPVDTAGTAGVCARCPPGRVPSADSIECVACPAGQWERSVGECGTCPAGQVPNAAGTACAVCPTGQTANADESACLCPANEVPEGEICVCGPDTVPALDGSCFRCPNGFVPHANGFRCTRCDSTQIETTPGVCGCPVGYAALLGNERCFRQKCEEPDEVGTLGSCVGCGAGQVPNGAHTRCLPCAARQAETTPGACVTCPDGHLPAASLLACPACPLDQAGTGGECGACDAGLVASADRTACEACPDGQRERSAGECEACPDGETPAADGTTCRDCGTDTAGTAGRCGRCGDGEVPNAAGTACRDCPPGTAELPAAQASCTACGTGQVPNATDTGCRACADGQTPDAVDLDACGDCGTDTAGTGGQCGRCEDGEVPNDGKTACVACAENEAETTPGECEVCPVGVCSDTTETVHGDCIDGGGVWTVAQAPDAARTSCLPPGVLDLLSPELALEYLLAISTTIARTLTVVQAAGEVFDVLDADANAELDKITGKLGDVTTLLTGGNALLGSLEGVVSRGTCGVATHTTRTACEAAGATWTRGTLDVADAEVARILGDVEDLLAGTGDDYGLTELHGALTGLRDGLDGCAGAECTNTDLGDIDDAIEALQASALSWGTDSDITRSGTTGSHWFVRARSADNACRCWGVAINFCAEARAGPFVRSYTYDNRTFDAAGNVLIQNSRCHSIECTDLAASAVRAAMGCTEADVEWVYSDTGSGGGDTAAVEDAVGDVETAIGDLGDTLTEGLESVEEAISGTTAEQTVADGVIANAEAGRRALITTTAAPQRTLPRTAGGSNDVGDLTAGALSGIATWRARSVAATCPAFSIDLSGVRIAPGVKPMGVVATTAHCPTAATVNLIRALFGFIWLIATVRIVLSS